MQTQHVTNWEFCYLRFDAPKTVKAYPKYKAETIAVRIKISKFSMSFF